MDLQARPQDRPKSEPTPRPSAFLLLIASLLLTRICLQPAYSCTIASPQVSTGESDFPALLLYNTESKLIGYPGDAATDSVSSIAKWAAAGLTDKVIGAQRIVPPPLQHFIHPPYPLHPSVRPSNRPSDLATASKAFAATRLFRFSSHCSPPPLQSQHIIPILRTHPPAAFADLVNLEIGENNRWSRGPAGRGPPIC